MAPWLVQRCEEGSSREPSPDSNRCRSYFWMARTAAARPGQRRDPEPSEPRLSPKLSGSETKAPLGEQRLVVGVGCVSRGGQRRGCTNTPSPGGTALTTFHRSLTRESTLRMSACSVPPLIPPADRGRCPQCLGPAPTCRLRPGPTFGLRRRTLRRETQKGYKSSKILDERATV